MDGACFHWSTLWHGCRKKGVIVNVSSGGSQFPTSLLAVYGATKVYTDFFSRALAREYASKGIIVQVHEMSCGERLYDNCISRTAMDACFTFSSLCWLVWWPPTWARRRTSPSSLPALPPTSRVQWAPLGSSAALRGTGHTRWWWEQPPLIHCGCTM